jgi:SAM-dependent methyltransferase
MQLKTLNNEYCQNLYEKYVVKDAAYFQRFEDLYTALSPEELSAYASWDPPRVVSFIDFKEWIKKYGIDQVDSLLSTCFTDPELRYIQYKRITEVNYPPHDLHTFDVSNKDNDFAIFNQTLEHLHTPILAINRIREHLKDGGYVYTTVPTINIPHMTPIHFNGLTPTGLCALMESCGFEVCECGYWGNKMYIDYIFTHGGWPNYKQVLDDSGKLKYDPVCQAQTWVLARKV